jgi:hypothetical protein
MPRIATYAELKERGSHSNARMLLEKASRLAGKNVFLSHITADDDLVPGAIDVLEQNGGQVYVDHQDPALTSSDCLAIADHLRKVIRACTRFVMLASPKSKDSRWIPWELGLGDGFDRQYSVALFPSAESSSDMSWSEREYLGLYRRIVWGPLKGRSEPCWFVWDFRANTGTSLDSWLKGS